MPRDSDVEPRSLLNVRRLEKQFVRRRFWRAPVVTRAVDDVSFVSHKERVSGS
jgi:ABC-type oligopeptide transport system ATPase subunit